MEYLRQYEILIRKAENDFKTAKLVYENIGDIEIETGLFHLQQATEKLIKAILIFNKVEAPKTHRLDVLFELIVDNNIDLELKEILLDLNEYAVDARYDYLSESFENFSDFLYEVEKLINNVKTNITNKNQKLIIEQ